MQLNYMQIILGIILNSKIVSLSDSKESITLYRHLTSQKQALEISVKSCVNSLPETFIQNISSGNFTIDCAQFFDAENCTGNSVEIKKSSVINGPWSFGIVKSIGPCNPSVVKINGTNFKSPNLSTKSKTKETLPEKSNLRLELFERPDMKGTHALMDFHEGCLTIPRKVKNRVSSLRMLSPSEICIVLYEYSDCTGKSVEIRQPPPQTVINLSQWGFEDLAHSVSLCGCPCPYEPETEDIECEHVTLYDEKDLKGNSRLITFSDCVDLNDDWEGAAESFRLLKNCVKLYSHFGCQTIDGASGVREFRKSASEEEKDFNLDEFAFDGQIRSIGLCDEDIPHQPVSYAIYMLLTCFFSGIIIATSVNLYLGTKKRRSSTVSLTKDQF